MSTTVEPRAPRNLLWGIAGAGLLVHVWAAWRGFFHMDDFFYLAEASGPFGDYVTQVYNGHLMPAQFAIVWVSQAVAPMSWPIAVLVVSAMWAATLGAAVVLQRSLFGASPWAIISVTILAFAPLLTTVTVWYASALQILPWAATFMLTLYFAVRHARDPRWRWVVAASLTFVIGLAFWQKSLLYLPVVLWLSWRYWPGTGRLGLGGLGRRWWLPAVTLGIAVAYGLVYLAAQSEAVLRSRPTLDQLVDSVRITLGEVWLPGYVGAPWTGFTDALVPGSSSAWWLFLLIMQGVIALVVISVMRWRSAWNAWFIIAVFAAVTVVLFVFGRINVFGIVLAIDPRYVEDLFVVGAVVLPFAFVRPAGSPLPAPRDLAWLPRGVPGWAQAVGWLAFANLLILPTIAVGRSWHGTPAQGFVSTVREVASDQPGIVIFDRKVPELVMSNLFLERSNASYVLAGAGLPIRWNGSAEQIYILNDDGGVRPANLAASSTSVPGFDGDCGYRVFGGPATIELDTSLFEWTWIGQIDYLAAEAGVLGVALDGPSVPVSVEKGAGRAQFVVVGGGDTLVITPPEGIGVCISGAVLGQDGPT
ncbi:MAG: hypothetical protein RL347_499 [Actinomycetota bacterium]|jgi:hypothetical protein